MLMGPQKAHDGSTSFRVHEGQCTHIFTTGLVRGTEEAIPRSRPWWRAVITTETGYHRDGLEGAITLRLWAGGLGAPPAGSEVIVTARAHPNSMIPLV